MKRCVYSYIGFPYARSLSLHVPPALALAEFKTRRVGYSTLWCPSVVHRHRVASVGGAPRGATLGRAPLRGGAMGCGASVAVQPNPRPALTGAALSFGQQFELTTPMLVMPFRKFKAQGRIIKSIKAWRDKALAAGSLVVHEESSGKIVIFISHTWWDRSFTDATNDPNNPYDKGAPDNQAKYPDEQRQNGYSKMVTYERPKNLKWRIIKYQKNELFIDVVEHCNLMMSSKGTIRDWHAAHCALGPGRGTGWESPISNHKKCRTKIKITCF